MNTLTDLRTTLDQHADSVSEAEATARLTAVHHRVAAVRRRRRAVGTGALALVLLAGTAVALVPRLTSDAQPAAPVILGQRAPTTMTSLGYTYRTDGHGAAFRSSGSVDVPKSDDPQLYSWTTTTSDTTVTVRTPDRETWHSDVTAFRDFVVIPAGVFGRLEVSADRGGVGVASYHLTDAVPAGAYSKGGITYRPEFAGAPLLRGIVSDRGQTDLTTSFVVPSGPVEFHLVCSGLPKGDVVHIVVGGKQSESGDSRSCGDPTEFDPASQSFSTQAHVGRPGTTQTVHIRVTGGFHDLTALPTGTAPDLRVGLGLYGPVQSVRTGAGRVPRIVEHGGHTWSFNTAATRSSTQALTMASAPVDRVAEIALQTRGTTVVGFRAGGYRGSPGTSGGGVLGGFFAPADAPVHVSLTQGIGSYGVALYERTD
jgi:hypothetical protein